MNSIHRFFVFASALVFLSACTAIPSEVNVSAASNSATTLTLWHTQSGASARLLDTLVADFRKANPNIVVRVEQKTSDGDVMREGLAALALNQPPDLIIANNRTLAEFARRDALVNLEPLIYDPKLGLSENERNDFIPSILDAGRFADAKNQLAALPFSTNAIVLYSNVALLKSAKLDAPPRTWDQFENAARATTKENVHGWAMSPSAAALCAIVYSRGGAVLNETQSQAQLNDATWLKSLQLIATLTKSDAAYLANAENARNDFVQGKTTFWIGATDELASLSDAVERTNSAMTWRLTHLPQNDPTRPMTAMTGEQIAIFNSTDTQTRAAWLFVRWLVATEQGARWSRVVLTLPSRGSVQSLLADNPSPQLARLRDGFGNLLPIVRALPNTKEAALIDAAIAETWTSVATGTDPATALKNANARVNRLLGQIQ